MAADVTLRHLRTFVAAAELGSFTLAAERLCVTQPGVSRSISELERMLGRRLFDREGRGAVLTPHGAELSRSLSGVLADLDAMLRRDEPRVLRIGFSHFLPDGWASDLVPRMESGRGVRIELCRRDDVRSALDQGECNVILCSGDVRGEHYAVFPVASEPRVVAVAAGSDLGGLTEITWPGIASHPVVVNVHDGDVRAEMWHPAPPPPRFVPSRNWAEWLELVALGRGVGVAPQGVRHRSPHPGVRYLDVVDGPPALTRLVARRAQVTPDVEELGRLAAALARPPVTAGT